MGHLTRSQLDHLLEGLRLPPPASRGRRPSRLRRLRALHALVDGLFPVPETGHKAAEPERGFPG